MATATKRDRNKLAGLLEKYLNMMVENNWSRAKDLPPLHIMDQEGIDLSMKFIDEDEAPMIDVGAKPTTEQFAVGMVASVVSDEIDENETAIAHRLESKRWKETGYAILVETVKTIPVSKARGRRLFSPYLCTLDFVGMTDRGVPVSAPGPRTFNWDGRKWNNIDLEKETSNKVIDLYAGKVRGGRAAAQDHVEKIRNDEQSPRISLLYGIHQWAKKVWRVEIGDRNGLRMVVECDPAGVRSLLKDRDREPGKRRRSPVIHWVSEHWRTSRIDENLEHEVIAHLRGMEKWFTWQGWDCQILIPERLRKLAEHNKATKRSKSRRKTLKVVKDERKVMKVELAEVEQNGEFIGYQVLVDEKVAKSTTSLDEAMEHLRKSLLIRAGSKLRDGQKIPDSMMRSLAILGAETIAATSAKGMGSDD